MKIYNTDHSYVCIIDWENFYLVRGGRSTSTNDIIGSDAIVRKKGPKNLTYDLNIQNKHINTNKNGKA